MPECGSQCWLCDLPIRYDTYKGCTHGCKYCFVQKKSTLEVGKGESVGSLVNFIAGKRTRETNWADWNIPIHWGGMSDPFQPCEKKYRVSEQALKVFAETQYPVVISTKGKLCIEHPWIDLIGQCNVVMQVSALCSKYDELEPGAPTFEERVHMIEVLSKHAKRVIVRAQPYIHEIFSDMLVSIERFAAAGAYGVIFEGMKFAKKKPGTVKCGADWVQPTMILESDFVTLRQKCHDLGLHFYSGENRLRKMGDSLTCCGIDGLEGFKGNTFNVNHLYNGDKTQPTPGQQQTGTAGCFQSINQTSAHSRLIKKLSFEEKMINFMYEHKDLIREVFGDGTRAVK